MQIYVYVFENFIILQVNNIQQTFHYICLLVPYINLDKHD